MSENTKIEWCDHTFNPWTGCTKVSPGCAHCYAESWSKRSGIVEWGPGKPRKRTSEANWEKPLKWDKEAAAKGVRYRVFCASLADWLDDEVPIEWLVDLLDLIFKTPNLDWLLLTKRPENFSVRMMHAWLFSCGWRDGQTESEPVAKEMECAAKIHAFTWGENPPANVWIGTTVEDQERADERIPSLFGIPAAVRFLSCEPLLEAVDLIGKDTQGSALHPYLDDPKIDWVICGGESGNGCRPFDAEWARSLRDQCKDAGVAFFMKQMGGARKPFAAIPADLMVREFPKGKGGGDE